ncbi:hypothetical protein CSE45_0046 [Citreicella sp. SE45]|nr:hypothetical protein CSE45_0046 [Citreicella sp. SE45]
MPLVGEVDAAHAADEERNADLGFERPHVAGDRALRDIEFGGGCGEAQGARRGFECPQGIDDNRSAAVSG